mgnify:CR=1 FL=1
MDKVHFSTGKDDWETPQWLFNQLDDEFHFTLDPCCTAENAKCLKYYTKAENGLEQDWKGETVFCNPPYSRGKKGAPGQEAWIKKCFEESKKAGTTCVMLLPARTDTKAFHTYIYGYAEIRFIRGRLKCALPGFVDSKNEEKTERNAGYLVVSHSGGGMFRQGTRKGIRRTPANRGMRAHWVVKGLDISEDVCHGMCP